MNSNIPYMISFSGGLSSAYMAHRLIATEKLTNYVIVFANTGKECKETLDFVHECDKRLFNNSIVWVQYANNENGFEIVNYQTAARRGEPFKALIEKRQFLPNVVMRFCTQELKVRPIKKYMQSLGFKKWVNVIGIRFDEPQRWSRLMQPNKQVWENWAPMYDWEIEKKHVHQFWQLMPFTLQLKPHQGNCDLCMLKGLKKKINIIRDNPEVATWWHTQEVATGSTFDKRHSIAQLMELAKQPVLFDTSDYDIDYPCHCNID